MKNVAEALKERLEEVKPLLERLDEDQWNAKPNPLKWSKKEILGHLTDSAHNNLNRFVRSQYEDVPHIVYDQDQWVSLQNYQQLPASEVLSRWQMMNEIVVNALQNIDQANANKSCNTGKENKDLHSLAWLAEDYVQHLNHHMKQIIG